MSVHTGFKKLCKKVLHLNPYGEQEEIMTICVLCDQSYVYVKVGRGSLHTELDLKLQIR
jgi:hypothetical protein